MVIIFILLQSILVAFMALHDWIHIPPFTDIMTLKKHNSFASRLFSSIINSILVLIPLGLTIKDREGFSFVAIVIVVAFYTLLTVGTVCAWWIPYFFGSSIEHKQGFVEYKNTHMLLPARGDNVMPNTVHIIMHLLIWVCLGIALYCLNHYLEFEKSVWVALFLYGIKKGFGSILSRI